MKKARLRFSTEIVRRLGEELNPSLDKGVIELVKNAYDADANECRVELKNAESPGGSVVVTDDGNGMTLDEIENGWLVLGKSTKSAKVKTIKGRIPAGSKGLGRLAALRMGKRAFLNTRPINESNTEHNLLIDWDEFDSSRIVDEVQLTVETASKEYMSESGTEITIEELRTGFNRNSVKRLARELILLADPFDDDPHGFRPELLAPEFRDLEVLVRRRYFQDAEYHLRAEVGADGYASARLEDWKGEELFVAPHDDIAVRRNKKKYSSPSASFNLWVFILNNETFSTRKSTVNEVRNWLGEFGGVHLYYNGLRVSSYGGIDDDWLGMNLSRVRSPEERPSTNTSIGRVDLADTNGQIIEKTDRSGFIENESFNELRWFAKDVMEWMADQRLKAAEKRRLADRELAPKKSTEAKRYLKEAITSAPVPVVARKKIEKALDSYERQHDRERDILQKEIQLYRTLSTAGITAVTFAHESSGNPIKVIAQSIDAIARRSKKLLGDTYHKLLSPPVVSIRKAVSSLSVLGMATLKLVNHEKRRISRVNLHDVVRNVLDTYGPFISGREVRVLLDLTEGNPYLRGSEAAVESIVTNLLNNSLAAFEDAGTQERTIRLSTITTNGSWQLSIEDNGPGIKGIRKAEIWLPGRTTRKNGTGLGLTIVRDAVNDLGGSVDAKEHAELGGAKITVELPILGE